MAPNRKIKAIPAASQHTSVSATKRPRLSTGRQRRERSGLLPGVPATGPPPRKKLIGADRKSVVVNTEHPCADEQIERSPKNVSDAWTFKLATKSIYDAWVALRADPHTSVLSDNRCNWDEAVAILKEAIRTCDRSIRSRMFKASEKVGLRASDGDILQAREDYFKPWGFDLESDLSAEALHDIGLYTSQEDNVRTHNEDMDIPIQNEGTNRERGDRICTARKPFTACIQCSRKCESAQRQDSYVNSMLAGGTASLQRNIRKLEEDYGVNGKGIGRDILFAVKDMMKAIHLGTPGTYESFKQNCEQLAQGADKAAPRIITSKVALSHGQRDASRVRPQDGPRQPSDNFAVAFNNTLYMPISNSGDGLDAAEPSTKLNATRNGIDASGISKSSKRPKAMLSSKSSRPATKRRTILSHRDFSS